MARGTQSTLDELFAGRPAARALFSVVCAAIDEIGPSTMRVTKTQVGFSTDRGFAWVWLPQMWTTKRASGSVTLAFALGRRVEDARIADAVEAHPGRWTHHVVIDEAAEVDAQVVAWLREAFLASVTGRRRA